MARYKSKSKISGTKIPLKSTIGLYTSEAASEFYTNKSKTMPKEKNSTAAWANTESEISASKVSIPSKKQTGNAKEYVDSNEK